MYLIAKRIFDILIAGIVLLFLSPLFIVCIIILKFTGEGEVFYKQQRIGRDNKEFGILKFATMLKNSENIGTGAITVRNDPRVTSFGKILRKTKINELPQVINVLNGSMSLVGPRPLMNVSFDLYPDEVKENIYKSKPGITGIGSIVFRDEEKIVSDAADPKEMYRKIFPYKGQLEMWYLKNKSFWTDIRIILITAWTILFSESNLVYNWFKTIPQRPF